MPLLDPKTIRYLNKTIETSPNLLLNILKLGDPEQCHNQLIALDQIISIDYIYRNIC